MIGMMIATIDGPGAPCDDDLHDDDDDDEEDDHVDARLGFFFSRSRLFLFVVVFPSSSPFLFLFTITITLKYAGTKTWLLSDSEIPSIPWAFSFPPHPR
jgi:hypothetical protein